MSRQEILRQARALSAEEVARLSSAVITRFQGACRAGIPLHPGWPRAGAAWKGLKVGLYRSQDHECDLRALEPWLEGQGASLHYPRLVDLSRGELEFAAKPGAESDWSRGSYGIEEPGADCPLIPPGALDLILVPGVAFGEAGERLGRGKGFYDRYLARATRAVRVALTFDFQIRPILPQKPWDQRVHWLFSEKREIRVP